MIPGENVIKIDARSDDVISEESKISCAESNVSIEVVIIFW